MAVRLSFPFLCLRRKGGALMQEKLLRLFVCAVIILYIFCIQAHWPLGWTPKRSMTLSFWFSKGLTAVTASLWLYYSISPGFVKRQNRGILTKSAVKHDSLTEFSGLCYNTDGRCYIWRSNPFFLPQSEAERRWRECGKKPFSFWYVQLLYCTFSA